MSGPDPAAKVAEAATKMAKLIRKITTSQQGFTLIELVVVIAILGVLAAVATPLMVNFLSGAKAQAYNADLEVVQTSVDAWFADPANIRFLGKNQYPLLGRNETKRTDHIVRCKDNKPDCNVVGSFDHPDNGDPFDPEDVDHEHKHHEDHGDEGHSHHKHPDHPDWNPLGGTQGADLLKSGKDGKQAWTDDKDGVREIQKASPDTWTTVKVAREGTEYFTDARYYFIDLKALVDAGFLKEAPKSSSKDNYTVNFLKDNATTGTGSYTYYLDNLGRVRTLLFAFASTGAFVEGVYP